MHARTCTEALRGTVAERVIVQLFFWLAIMGTTCGALIDFHRLENSLPWKFFSVFFASLLQLLTVAVASVPAYLFSGEPLDVALRGSQRCRALVWGLAAASFVVPSAAIFTADRSLKYSDIIAPPHRDFDRNVYLRHLNIFSGQSESSSFLQIGLHFSCISTLNAAKALLDHADANFIDFYLRAAPSLAHARELAPLTAAGPVLSSLNFGTASSAFVSTFYCVWSLSSLAIEFKAFFSVGLFSAVSASEHAHAT
jgi:hypothetical protein